MQQTNDLLLPFEEKLFPKGYKDYLETRRHNYANCIQAIPGLWDLYMSLDQIWVREFADMRTASDPSQILPSVVFINAHIKIRIGMELVFSASMEESRSILRDAVEWTATAHYLLGAPELQRVWLQKNENPRHTAASLRATRRRSYSRGSVDCISIGVISRRQARTRTLMRPAIVFKSLTQTVTWNSGCDIRRSRKSPGLWECFAGWTPAQSWRGQCLWISRHACNSTNILYKCGHVSRARKRKCGE